MTLTTEEREYQAQQEAGQTDFSSGVKPFLCIYFVALIASGAFWQLMQDLRDDADAWPKTIDPTRLAPTWDEIRGVATSDGWIDALKLANHRTFTNIEDYESVLEDSSPLINNLVPSVNLLVTGMLRGSTESVYPGLREWLFYRHDVEYVTSRGFLDPAVMDARRDAEPDTEPDPLLAIVELRDTLSLRNIELLVVPVPVKPTIYPENYTRRFAKGESWIQNPSYPTYLQQLDKAGIPYVDLTEILWQARARASQPLYLQTDTHWTPFGMRVAAEAIAKAVSQLNLEWKQPVQAFTYSQIKVSNQGDTLAMLRLPQEYAESKAELVTVDEVLMADDEIWSSDTDAEILFLGDSFANIYSQSTLGWGSGAGLAEHVSAELGRRIDAIVVNDNGSYATRLALAGQIRRGRDRLKGKQIVIYEFASRELAFGDWKIGLPY